MRCHHFDAGSCRSCTWLGLPYAEQLARKQDRAERTLAPYGTPTWLPAVANDEIGMRTKAKLVVAGTVERPTLGILDPDGRGVDLRDCPLHTPGLRAAADVLARFVTLAGLTPYDVPDRSGELKHLILTEAPDAGLMVRFVLRSTEALARIRKHLPALLAELPVVRVASVNLQPVHAAVLEGGQEIVLTDADVLVLPVGDVRLHLRPQSFVQTSTGMAARLYRQAAAWADELGPTSVWDLYCGTGGFALHLAGPGRSVVGVEASAPAVAAARTAAAGLTDVRFEVADATVWAKGAGPAPDLVVVNPPRRGVGPELADWLTTSGAAHVLYSSCNVTSLAQDLARMAGLRPVRAQVLDMFPHTPHDEVLVLLGRSA